MSEQVARALVAERAQHMCEIALAGICGVRMASVHHRLKRSHGGGWVASNLLASCGDGTTGCHGYIEAHPTWAREEGLWLFAGDGAPHEVSVHMRWMNLRGWYLLDDEGMLTFDGGPTESLWQPAEREYLAREMVSPGIGWG